MSSSNHLRVINGSMAGLKLPTIVEFEMKDVISAIKGLCKKNKFIKVYVQNGQINFSATSNPHGDYTFMSPLGSDPELAMSRDRDVYATAKRYRGPIISMCRQLVEKWNSESTEMLNRGFKVVKLKFNEK